MKSDLLRLLSLSMMTLALAVNVGACDDGDDEDDGDGDGAGDGGDGGDGTGGDGTGDAGDGGDAGCEDGGGADPNADCDAYTNCIMDKCGADYDACYGPDYFAGEFSGECASWLNCAKDCGCDDTTCAMDCFNMATPECITCTTTTAMCAAAMCQAELDSCAG